MNSTTQSTVHHQTNNTCRNRLSSDQIRTRLPQSVIMNGDFVLRECRAVFGGNDTGYLRPLNAPESDALYNSINGMVTTHIQICGSKYPRFLKAGEKPNRKRGMNSFGSDKRFNFENLDTVYCRHGGWKDGCGVKGQIWRFQFGNDNDQFSCIRYMRKLLFGRKVWKGPFVLSLYVCSKSSIDLGLGDGTKKYFHPYL